MQQLDSAILDHHHSVAAMWSEGGRGYDDVSYGISDALAHAAQRLAARPGESVLDLATGTGWTARNVARCGAQVTAVDFAPGLLDAAAELSAHLDPPIDFRLADAERLPFADGSFDRVISTFGVMFAADQIQAAAELARICRPGGRLVLAVWVPVGAVAEFFSLIGRHGGPAPEPGQAAPLDWGDPDHVRSLLGGAFDLQFERGVNNAYYDGTEDAFAMFANGFGPVRRLLADLDAARRDALRADIDAYHAQYAAPAGLHIRRDYLIIIGRPR